MVLVVRKDDSGCKQLVGNVSYDNIASLRQHFLKICQKLNTKNCYIRKSNGKCKKYRLPEQVDRDNNHPLGKKILEPTLKYGSKSNLMTPLAYLAVELFVQKQTCLWLRFSP